MRKRTLIALLPLFLLMPGCEDARDGGDRPAAESEPPAEGHEEEEAPEFEPLDGHFTVDTARVSGSEVRNR